MELNLKKLEKCKESFLKWYPDGKDFDHPEYLAGVRRQLLCPVWRQL